MALLFVVFGFFYYLVVLYVCCMLLLCVGCLFGFLVCVACVVDAVFFG